MRRTPIFAAAALVVLLAAFSAVALGASPHFKRGGEPTCTITGTTSKTVVCTGTLAGLGNGDLLIDTTVSGFAVYQCQNPSGQNEPPGQNRVLVGPETTPTTIDSDAIKNGTVKFTTNPATLTADDTVSGTEAGCNNDKWNGVNPTLTFTDITLEISQGGTLLFTCTASNPDGLSGTVRLSC
jgi:hypothetical protein